MSKILTRPSLEVWSLSGKLLGLIDDEVIRRFPADFPVSEDEYDPLFRCPAPTFIDTLRVVRLQFECWGESPPLTYRCLRADT